MPSLVQALLALFLIAIWSGVEVFQFRAPMHGAPLLVALGVLPLAWWRRSPALLFWGLAVLFVVTAFAVGWIQVDSLFSLLFMMGAAAIATGIVAAISNFADAEGPLRRIGLFVVLGVGYALTFPRVTRELGRADFSKPWLAVYFGAAGVALLAAVAAGAVALARGGMAQIDSYRRWQVVLVGAGLAIVLWCLFARTTSGGWAIALPFNVIVLGLAAALILEGSARLQPRLVGAGCLVFAIVTFSRYTDLFSSLLARSAVFVALGAALFLVGNFYARQRRRTYEVPQ
jgi:hypothetical protein